MLFDIVWTHPSVDDVSQSDADDSSRRNELLSGTLFGPCTFRRWPFNPFLPLNGLVTARCVCTAHYSTTLHIGRQFIYCCWWCARAAAVCPIMALIATLLTLHYTVEVDGRYWVYCRRNGGNMVTLWPFRVAFTDNSHLSGWLLNMFSLAINSTATVVASVLASCYFSVLCVWLYTICSRCHRYTTFLYLHCFCSFWLHSRTQNTK